MNKEQIKNFLREKKGYLKFGKNALAKTLKTKDVELCGVALREVKQELNSKPSIGKDCKNFNLVMDEKFISNTQVFKNAFKTKDINKSLTNIKRDKITGKNVLVIGDIHEPFTLEGYMEFCKEQYDKYKCDTVVFIGDIIDNHASSYHETDPDGYNAGEELRIAISNIRKWYKVFPKATVIIGNHDRIIMRKAYTAGLSKMWIKDYSEVLGTPGWTFRESIEIDNVLYVHGEGGTARSRVRRDLQSVVQGHLHSQAYVEWIVGAKFKLFGMQVGCGIDHKSYAMAYGKEGPKPAISCGVILKGEIPINLLMNL